MPYVLFSIICLIWGSSFILMKRAMAYLSPVGVGAGRAIGGTLVLAIIFVLLRQQRTVRPRDLGILLVVAVLGFVWPHSLQPELVAKHGGAFVGMTVGCTPLLTILVSIPILGIWPTQRQMVGVIGALCCLFCLLADMSRHTVPLVDILLALSVPFSYSIANGIIRRSLSHLPALELTLLCLFTAGSILLPMSMVIKNEHTPDSSQFVSAIVAVATLGVVGTGIATFLFNRLVQDQGPLFAAMTTNLVPVGAILWGLADGEQITTFQVVALFGLLVMVTYVQLGAAKPIEMELNAGE